MLYRPSDAGLRIDQCAIPGAPDPGCDCAECIVDVLAVEAAQAGEAGIIAAHARYGGVGLHAEDPQTRLPVRAKLTTTQRTSGMNVIPKTGYVDCIHQRTGHRREWIGPASVAPTTADVPADVEPSPVHRPRGHDDGRLGQ
jgi:hypothetical protein